MKIRWLYLILVLLVLLSVPSVYTAEFGTELENNFDSHNNVKVIVRFKDQGQSDNPNGLLRSISAQGKVSGVESKFSDIKNKRIFTTSNGFAAQVSRIQLEQLQENPDIQFIYPDRPVRITLADSVSHINATAVTALNLNGNNITGHGQTICIIDTGINYTHANLGGCTRAEFVSGTCSKVIAGYDYVNDDNDPYDDHGHGTHVGGIVAAGGSIQGVAPDAKIVSIKALDSTGSGDISDIIAAVEWCTGNATIYNITAISMSLGTTALFSSHCDGEEPNLATAVNNAIANNISVIASTANDASSTGISSPGCINNVTAVASTTKADDISSFSNTNSITDLLAPGSLITSTKMSGGSQTSSGTSMAAPHVSGAIALLQNYAKEEKNITLVPSQVESVFMSGGANLTDTRNGLVFPRIDVWGAVAEIETINPKLVVDSPVNKSTITNSTVAINFSATDNIMVDLCTLTNSTGQSSAIADCSNTTFVGIRGYQNVTIAVKDRAGNVNQTTIFFTINLAPLLTLVEPANQSYRNSTPLSLSFLASDEDLDSIWYNIDDGANVTIVANTTFSVNGSGHLLNLFANDTLNQISNASVRFSVDAIGANLTFVAPTPNNETFNLTNTITINITSDENLSTAILELDNLNETMDGSGTNWYLTKSLLGEGNHTFRVHVNDSVNNTGISQIRYVGINTIRNESSYFEQLNGSNSNVTIRLLQSSGEVKGFSNISVVLNYTMEFNISGTLVQIADFKWKDVNTSGVVNITTIVSAGNVSANFSAAGAVLNRTIWVEMNGFLGSNFTPTVKFDNVYRVFFYLNGSRQSPNSTRITEICNVDISIRPCYTVGENNSTVYLLTFSGAAGGQDIENPGLKISAPTGAGLGATAVTLQYVATDNAAIDSCFYNLNGGGNITLADCANDTITAIQGANRLSLYVNDTSGRLNQSDVNFTVTISTGGSAGGAGAGGGSGGGGGAGGNKPAFSVAVKEDIAGPVISAEEESVAPACLYEFDVALPAELSLVTSNWVVSDILYTGDCDVSDSQLELKLQLSDHLEQDIGLSNYSVQISDLGQFQFRIIRKAGVRNNLPGFITGSAIKDLTNFAVDNLNATKTLTGQLGLEARVGEEIVFSSSFPLELEVFTMENVTTPMITIGGTLAVLALVGGIAVVLLIRRRRMMKF